MVGSRYVPEDRADTMLRGHSRRKPRTLRKRPTGSSTFTTLSISAFATPRLGREAITGLLDDPVTAVRLAAAAHCLRWEPERAQLVLEEIEQRPTDLYAVDAKWTLRSYRAGTLNLDW